MRSIRFFLTGMLIIFMAVCSTTMLAGEGLQYVNAYNALLKGIQDRGGLGSTSPKPYLATSSVTQEDLNVLRGSVTGLAKNSYVEIEDASEVFDSEATANEIFKPLYYLDDKGTTDTSDDEWKFRALNRDFIKVPGKYTKFGKGHDIISNSFTDVPVLWTHFSDMVTILNDMKYKKNDISFQWYKYSHYYTDFINMFMSRTLQVIKQEEGDGWDAHLSHIDDTLVNPSSNPSEYELIHERYQRKGSVYVFFIWHHDLYIKVLSVPLCSAVKKKQIYVLKYFRYYSNTPTITEFTWDINDAEVGTNIEYFHGQGKPPFCEAPIDPDVWAGMDKQILTSVPITTYEFSPVKLTNPAKTMDSSGNDVVMAGCVTCKLGESFVKQFTDAGMSAQFPLGMSSGFDSGLIVFSYLSNYKLGDFKYSHHNLNTYIVKEYPSDGNPYEEPDGNEWKFTLVQRPRGAQVLMGWQKWTGDTPEEATSINGNSYVMTEGTTAGQKIITFDDGVVQTFAGGLVKCEKMEEDELLEVTPPGSGLSVVGSSAPSEVTSWGLLRSKPTYNTDGTCSEVYYYVIVFGIEIPFAKYVVTYTTQTLAARVDPDVYYVADASNIINYSLFATDPPPPAQEVEVVTYSYYKYIDGEYVLQSETKTSTDAEGNPTFEESNVDNGVATGVAKNISFTTLESEDPSITISQKTVTEGTNTFVTITKTKAYPWGNEVIEKIEGFGTADEKTTTYDYHTAGDGYGKVKSAAYPDGTWVRYEYNSDGREVKRITPVGNVAITAAENLCRVTEYDYNAYVTGDTVGDGDTRPRMTVQSELGVEISRSYQGFLDHEYLRIVCQTAGATWDATDNLVTHKYSYTSGDFAGRHWKQVNPDGTMSITSYLKTTDTFTTTVETGSGSGDTVTDGIRSISVMNDKGWTVNNQTIDIDSGLTLSSATYTHDNSGRVIRTDYADGTYTSTVYACCGPAQQINREGTTTDIMYDTLKRVINRETDGIASLYTYDANNRVLTSTIKGAQGAEQTTTNTYNTAGELVSTTAPDGAVTTYSETWVDGVRYSSTTYPNGKTQITKYNLDGSVAESYGSAGRHVKYEYGIETGERYQKVIMVGDNDSEAMWTQSYTNFAGQNYKTVNSAGAISLTEYDNIGRPIKRTAPNGVVSLTEYNAKGEPYVSAIDINQNGTIDYAGTDRINKNESVYESKSGTVVNKRTSSVYATDSSATPTVVSVSEGAVDGSASWQTSFGNVRISQTVLNGSGARTITVTNPDASTVVAVYQSGRIMSSTHSVLGLTTYTYDEFNRVSSTTHSENGVDMVTAYTYNTAGQTDKITLTSGANSRETSYVYNNMGARTSVTLPDNRVVNYTYTDTGELATVNGSDTYPQAYTYDALGKMKTLTTYKAYPGTSEITIWNYDAASGFMTSKIYADGKGTTYTYNPAGQLLTRLWERGITTTYGYDNAGAQNSIDYSDTTPDISFVYDRMGRIKTVADVSGTRTQTYNSSLRLASSSIPHILDGKMEYVYDSLGRMSSVKLMQDTTEKLNNAYTYDAMSRIATVSDGTNTAEYTRLAGTNMISNIAVKQGANTKLSTTKIYDAFNRLLSTSSVAGATTRTYTYEYNDKDQRTKLTLADGSTWEYTYDDKGQVTSGIKKDAEGRTLPGQSFNYSFDDIGNRLTETKGMPQMLFNYTANNVNQYTQRTVPGIVPIAGSAATDAKVSVKNADTGQVYHTTRDGKYFIKAIPVSNTTAAKEANLEIHAVKFDVAEDKDIVKTVSGKYLVAKTPQIFTYDTDGNMLTDGSGWNYTWNGENRMIEAYNDTIGKKLECAYDFGGRRISKKVYTGSTGNWTLSTHQKFIYNGYKQIAEYNASDVLQKTYTWQPVSLDVPLWVKDGSNYYYYIVDGNKNVRAMVDTSANEVASYDYNPFGKIVVISGSYATVNVFRFSCEYHDDETGLVYYNYRYYDASLGRWTKRDPIGEKGGYNLYVMVSNNPVSLWDNLGLDFIAVADRAVDGLGGFAYHYSLQKWECCAKFRPLGQTKGFTMQEIRKKCKGNGRGTGPASKVGLELLAEDNTWTAWRNEPMINIFGGIGSRLWTKVPVNISVIHYSDTSDRIMPILDGDSQKIDARWQRIVSNAKKYPWAEQEGFNGNFKNWPNSLYADWISNHYTKTNSNTFVRYILRQASLAMPEMDGNHPGRSEPSSDSNDSSYTFHAYSIPWRTGTKAPPRPPNTDY